MKAEPVAGTSMEDHLPDLPVDQDQPQPEPLPSTSAAVPKPDMNPWQRAKLIKLSSAKETEITRAVAYHIVDDMRPYSTISSKSFRYCMVIAILMFHILLRDENYSFCCDWVNHEIFINFSLWIDFRHLLHVCEPRYVPPSKNTMSEQIIPGIHQSQVGKLRSELDNVDYVGVTTDGWSSRAVEAYETYTVHYIKDWKLISKVFIFCFHKSQDSYLASLQMCTYFLFNGIW